MNIKNIIMIGFIFSVAINTLCNDSVQASELLTSDIKMKDFKAWNSSSGTSYVSGELVNNKGVYKKVIQNFTANGDENWWNAPSLFSAELENNSLYNAKDINNMEIDSTSGIDYIDVREEQIRILSDEHLNTNSKNAKIEIENDIELLSDEIQTFYENNPEVTNQLFPEKQEINSKAYYGVADSPSLSNWIYYGDILATKGLTTSSLYVGHAAIADIEKNWYVESCPKGKCSGATKDGVQYRSDYNTVWKNQKSSEWGRYHVKNATDRDYLNSLGYAQKQVGLPYNWKFNSGGYGFYCSELVGYAWKVGGVKDVISGSDYDYILPGELVWSSNTYRVEGGW